MAGAIPTLLVGVLTAIGTNLGSSEGLSRRTIIAIPLSVACLASFWEYQVTKIVPEPYLDEVFHIPQAQAYCRWDYGIWDPKLTTPPGLYWWSHLLSIVSGYTICDAHFLRVTNVIALTFIMMLAWECRSLIIRAGVANRIDQVPKLRSVDSLHTAVNIALFPPLFFFSGLYYTDVLSTCVVLYLYKQFLEQAEIKKLKKPRKNGGWFYLCGILALCMRQTNIFWVAIFLGGMEAIRTMKEIYRLTAPSFKDPEAPSQEELKEFCDLAKSEHPHDPPVHAAGLEDLLLTPLSILWTAIDRLPTILLRLIPHILLLMTFGIFVFINGGVVLGDKSNHVATIHLPQLLYLWPFITFFSFPLLLPALFSFLSSPIDNLLHPSKFLTSPLNAQIRALITLGLMLASLLGSLIIIKYNTIIHPFTLADNRHYIFYVFRYTILRHPLIRYLLAPIYIFCFYLIVRTLSGRSSSSTSSSSTPDPPNQIPISPEMQHLHFLASFENPMRKDASFHLLCARDEKYRLKPHHDASPPPPPPSSTYPNPKPTTPSKPRPDLPQLPTTPLSTYLLLLLTTSLSLITAPLVEPRYFILPFIFLRLHIPTLTSAPSHSYTLPLSSKTPFSESPFCKSDAETTPWYRVQICGEERDVRLYAETIWYLFINAVTGYVFLYRGFEWVQEGGRVQRFMW
ncbi:hypothetical protein OCU04_009843 [Sclerotinia nivalis]|uniref:Dol-P-Glc:Glc(2)Man(9)GlcNAc(2)-PP-Dol alpha-1,2-glucosyltransferase n=2 Tax=Sclerotinia nivalis TaxID=352851 RepID=A0A9X0AH25_9HELO|nr:hypothetical protein OCU04_009843 [Sclerotinia nivalis]